MTKFKTEKGKIYFHKRYYILKNDGGGSEVGRDGYNSKRNAVKESNGGLIFTPRELIKIDAAWDSFFNCYDIDIRS